MDKAFARRLHDQLQGKGIRCWLDEHQLLPGDDIYRGIDRGIKLWDKVLLCCSEASLTSWWVDKELEKAFEKERRLMKEGSEQLALIPVRLDDYVLSDSVRGKASILRERKISDFIEWKDHDKFEAAFERVVKALRADGAAREEPPEPKL